MQLSTIECVLTDIMSCGYADLDMLSILYSTIGDEVLSYERESLVKDAGQNGGLNYVLFEAYSIIKERIADELEELINDYINAESKEEKAETDLANEALFLWEEKKVKGKTEWIFKPLKKKQIKEIKEKVQGIRESEPYTNCLDSSFQNDLDQVFYEDNSIRDNAINLIKYWVK